MQTGQKCSVDSPAAGTRTAALLRRWRGRLATFASGQALMQLLALWTGLMLMRWMPEQEYAKAGLVLGFQILFGAFADLGIGGALVAVIGTRGGDRDAVGAVLAAARWWRRALLAVVIPLGASVFLPMHLRQGWSLAEGLVLYGFIAATLAAAGVQAAASAPLLVHQRLGTYYGIGAAGAAVRLAGAFALYRAGRLDALGMVGLNALVTAACACAASHAARRHVAAAVRSTAGIRAALRRTIAPQIPSTLFYALQGQLTTFLIAWFGQTQHLAEVTALGRLGQLFAFLSAAYATLALPYCARQSDAEFLRRHGAIVAVTLGIAAAACASGFLLPEPLLWLLGPRYAHLRDEVGWMITGAALGFAGGAIWTVHAARRWVFWSSSALYIGSVTAVQMVLVCVLDLSRTRDVLLLGVATNATALLVQGWTGWLGRRGLQRATVAVRDGDPPRASTPA